MSDVLGAASELRFSKALKWYLALILGASRAALSATADRLGLAAPGLFLATFFRSSFSLLALGNYMNKGARGNAHGFKINSLTKVGQSVAFCDADSGPCSMSMV